jgi:hypothetical protein
LGHLAWVTKSRLLTQKRKGGPPGGKKRKHEGKKIPAEKPPGRPKFNLKGIIYRGIQSLRWVNSRKTRAGGKEGRNGGCAQVARIGSGWTNSWVTCLGQLIWAQKMPEIRAFFAQK